MSIKSQLAVRPLQKSANSWAAVHLTPLQEAPTNLIKRELQALLNKLTWSNFDLICGQILARVDSPDKAEDNKILRELIAMILEQATHEGPWSEICAKLCQKLSLELKGPPDGWQAGQWFSQFLVPVWAEPYYWRADHLLRRESVSNKDDPKKRVEALSDDHRVLLERRRRLGLFRFSVELFKVNLITETQMHYAIKFLLREKTKIQEHIVYLRYVLINCGKLLDQPKAKGFMDLYIDTLIKVSQSPFACSRTRFMIQDIIDAHNNGWNGRKAVAGSSLDVDQPHNLRNPLSTQQPVKTELNATPHDKNKILKSVDKDFFSSWTPTQIWTNGQQNALLEAVLCQQQLEVLAVNGNLSSQGWTDVTAKLKNKFGHDFHPRWLRHQLHRVHETYLDIKYLQNRFGFKWDEKNLMITAAPNTWDQLIKENPKKKYSQLRNRRGPIGWYSLAQQVFNRPPANDRKRLVFFNHNRDKRVDIQNDAANSKIASASTIPTTALVSQQNSERISSDESGELTHTDSLSASSSGARKQPCLSDRDPAAKENGDRVLQTVPANAFKNTIHSTPEIKTKVMLPDPPMEAVTSTKPCVTEQKKEATSPKCTDSDGCMVPLSSTSGARTKPLGGSGCVAKEEPVTSGSTNLTATFVSKRNHEVISPDNDGGTRMDPSSSCSRATKQPRLSNQHPMDKENGDSTPQTAPPNASKNSIQSTTLMKREDVLPDAPMKAITSTEPCVTEKNNEQTSSTCADCGMSRVPLSSTTETRPQPLESSGRPARVERAVGNEVSDNVEKNQRHEDNQKPSNPTIQAIILMAPMFVDQVSPLEYVKFVQVVENQTNAQIFLSLVSTTNPTICKTWLQQKCL